MDYQAIIAIIGAISAAICAVIAAVKAKGAKTPVVHKDLMDYVYILRCYDFSKFEEYQYFMKLLKQEISFNEAVFRLHLDKLCTEESIPPTFQGALIGIKNLFNKVEIDELYASLIAHTVCFEGDTLKSSND